MTLQKKLARETGREIYLYKQGVFWVAYEQSALLLILEKNLKPSVRFIKSINREVLSVGFPEATKSYFIGIFGSFSETGKNTGYFKLNDKHDKVDLHAQREQILQQTADKGREPDKQHHPDTLAGMIMAFSLAEKTPMEAMMFVKDLQDKIRQGM